MDHVKFCKTAHPFMLSLLRLRLNRASNTNLQRTSWYYVQLMNTSVLYKYWKG